MFSCCTFIRSEDVIIFERPGAPPCEELPRFRLVAWRVLPGGSPDGPLRLRLSLFALRALLSDSEMESVVFTTGSSNVTNVTTPDSLLLLLLLVAAVAVDSVAVDAVIMLQH